MSGRNGMALRRRGGRIEGHLEFGTARESRAIFPDLGAGPCALIEGSCSLRAITASRLLIGRPAQRRAQGIVCQVLRHLKYHHVVAIGSLRPMKMTLGFSARSATSAVHLYLFRGSFESLCTFVRFSEPGTGHTGPKSKSMS
jgi:hypothetical protein